MKNNKHDECLTSYRSASGHKLDAEKYLPQMDDYDLTEAQKIELLQNLWSIMKAFVDVGFSVDSIQTFFPELAGNPSAEPENAVESKDGNRIVEFENAAQSDAAKDGT